MTAKQYNTEGAIDRMRELVSGKVPFVHQGRGVHGIDCVGALVHAFEYRGEIPSYPRDPINGELETHLERVFGPPLLVVHPLERLTDQTLLRTGDIVSMQYKGPSRHVAVLCEHVTIPGVLSVIHTDASLGRVTEHILDAKWLRRIVKVWRP